MESLLKSVLGDASVWEILTYLKNVTIFVLCITIAISVIFIVAGGLPVAWYWYTIKDTDGVLAYPYFIGLTHNVCWFTYGVYIRDWGMVALNTYCLAMTVLYVVVVYKYKRDRTNMNWMIILWITVVSGVQYLLYQQPTAEDSSRLIGRITVCLQTTAAASLLYILYDIFKRWSLEFLPFFPTLMGFAIEAQIFTLGVLVGDRYMMMANGFFMVLNGIIVSLFFILPADRQLAVPDLFTFFRDRLYDLHEYWSKRTTDEKTIMRKDSRENVTGTEAYEDYKED